MHHRNAYILFLHSIDTLN